MSSLFKTKRQLERDRLIMEAALRHLPNIVYQQDVELVLDRLSQVQQTLQQIDDLLAKKQKET